MLRLCVISSPPRQRTNAARPAQPTASLPAAPSCGRCRPLAGTAPLAGGRAGSCGEAGAAEGQKALALPAAFQRRCQSLRVSERHGQRWRGADFLREREAWKCFLIRIHARRYTRLTGQVRA